jgi:hypothetical protein
MDCGNGSERTPHPAELLGEDWYECGDWGIGPPGGPNNGAGGGTG